MSEIIHFLLLPGFSAMGFISALEPLRVANRFRGPLYRWRVLSLDGGAVQASNGMSVNADGVLGEGEAARMLLIVAGFEPLACYGVQLHQVLRRLDHEGVLLGGIDTGAMVLAEAGLRVVDGGEEARALEAQGRGHLRVARAHHHRGRLRRR